MPRTGGNVYDEDWTPLISYGFQRPSYLEYGFQIGCSPYEPNCDLTRALDKVYPQGVLRVFRGNVESTVVDRIKKSLKSKQAQILEFDDTACGNETYHHVIANWRCGHDDMCGAVYVIQVANGYTAVARFLGTGAKWEGEPSRIGTPRMLSLTRIAKAFDGFLRGRNFVVKGRMNEATLQDMMIKPETW